MAVSSLSWDEDRLTFHRLRYCVSKAMACLDASPAMEFSRSPRKSDMMDHDSTKEYDKAVQFRMTRGWISLIAL